MKSMPVLLAVLIIIAPGCSIYKASTAPPPVPVEKVTIGVPRQDVLSVFGSPKNVDTSSNERSEMYEFVDGNHGASKLRILVYIGGDLVTLGLAELIFWPMELTLLQGAEGRAVVTYTPEDRVKTLLVTDKAGKPWQTSD